jgi:hypothetical protein
MAMVRIELDDSEARRLREILGIARDELLREIAHTDDRAFRHELVIREELLAKLLGRLAHPGAEAA